VGRNLTRWLIPLPAILFAIWPTAVRAEPIQGLNATYYTIDVIPPVQSTSEYPVCGSETENNINRSYDGEPYENCTGDYFMVHMIGFITIPQHDTIEFMLAHDDGGEITIGGNTFGVWNDQGCSWSMSDQLVLNAETVPLELFMYENGGSTCIMLVWNINGAGWEMVPDEAFTTNGAPATTTTSTTTTSTSTTTSTTTTTTTTTTLPETTTTTSSTTTLPPTTTTTTSTTVPQTTTTSTIQSITTTTTTQVPWTPPQTTTTTTTTTVPEPATTTTTSVPETSTTLQETSTTVPDETVPETTQPSTTVPKTTVPKTTVPVETTSPTTTVPQTEETTDTTLEEVESSSTTTIPDKDPTVETPAEVAAFVQTLDIKQDEPISDAKVEKILEVLADASPAQVVAAVAQILATNITSDQAVSIASTPEVLAAVTEEQAVAIFEEIVVEELTLEVAEELVAVLNEAPDKVKEAFQETINVFAGVFDSFQMVGQTIPVGERRTLVAVSNTLVAVGTSLRRRDRQ